MALSKLPGVAIVARVLVSACLVAAAGLALTPIVHGQSGSLISRSMNDRWMTQIAAAYPSYGNLTLAQTLFPGSHDSATYGLENALGPDLESDILGGFLSIGSPSQSATFQDLVDMILRGAIGAPIPGFLGARIPFWATTQADNILTQLGNGIRVFDLRLCDPKPGETEIRMCHGIYGPTLTSILSEVNTFFGQPGRNKEIVILELGGYSNFSQRTRAQQEIVAAFGCTDQSAPGCRMQPVDPDKGAGITLQDIWNNGKNVIVLYDNPVTSLPIWNKSSYFKSSWVDQRNLASLEPLVVANLDCRCNTHFGTATAGSNQLFQLDMMATPDPPSEMLAEIKQLLLPLSPPLGPGTRGLADATNPEMIAKLLSEGHVALNIVDLDFAVQSGLVEAIKNLTIAKLDGASMRHGSLTGAQIAALTPALPAIGRAYLSRTDSPTPTVSSMAATVMTSWNGTHFGYTRRIQNGDRFIPPGYPALAHSGTRLFAGDVRVTSIADDFLSPSAEREWTNGIGFAVNVGGVSPSDIFALPAGYGEGYGRLYVAWTDPSDGYRLKLRSSSTGASFVDASLPPLNLTGGIPVLTPYMGSLYMAWADSFPEGRLHYGLINPDNTVVDYGPIATDIVARPAMTGFGDRLVFAWAGPDRKIRVMSVDPTSNVASDVVTLEDTTQAFPSLAVFKKAVVLAYTGEDGNRYTLTSTDGLQFPSANRTSQGPPSNLTWAAPTLHAWGDPVHITAAMRKGDGTPLAPGDWSDQNVTVTLSCEAPVAGVNHFIAGDDITGNSKTVTVFGGGRSVLDAVSCVDYAGNMITASPEVKIDRTPPTITYVSSTPTRPASGWYTTAVTSRFRCEDADSGPAEAEVIGTLSVGGEGMVTLGTCVDKAGNRATAFSPDRFNIDLTPPTVTFLDRSPAPNRAGWNNTSVTVRFTVQDSLSGLSGDSIRTVVLATEGGNQAPTVVVSDVAGNTLTFADANHLVNIDITKPTLTVPDSFTRTMTGKSPFWIGFPTPDFGDDRSPYSLGCDHYPNGAFYPEGPTTVTCSVIDVADNVTTKSFVITVIANKPPIIATISSAPVDEGSSATVTVAASDPDGDSASLKYQFDCDGDGTFDAAPQAAATASCHYDDNGPHIVKVRVVDKDGAEALSSTTIDVVNVAPSATFSNSGPVDEGSSFTLTMSGATDPSNADTAAGFRYAFDCGTGYGALSSSKTATCQAGGSGSLTVRGKVRDKDNGEREYLATVTVNGVPPAITVPAGLTASATAPDGAVVTFDVSATDAVDGSVAVSCSPASGSTFPLGTTPVICSATDKHGNGGRASFNVSVVDTTPPVVGVSNVVSEATGPNGASVAFSASATDAVDPHPVVRCGVVSGAVFPIGVTAVTCVATDASGNSGTAGFSVTVRDTIAPAVIYGGNAGSYTVDQTVNIHCAATDSGSGVASTTCADIVGPAYSFAAGTNAFSATATDRAGNVGSGATSFTVVASAASLQALVSRFCTDPAVAQGLNAKLAAAAKAPNTNARAGQLGAFGNQVRAQTGKTLTADRAATLLRLVALLY
jgi:HYR domain-containing protein/PKD domain-containing protein